MSARSYVETRTVGANYLQQRLFTIKHRLHTAADAVQLAYRTGNVKAADAHLRVLRDAIQDELDDMHRDIFFK